MPKDLIESFQENYNVHIDGQIRFTIDRILNVSRDNKSRESTIKDYINSEYPKVAAEYERNKVQASILNHENTNAKTPFEFFEEYINFISNVVKESSDKLLEQAKEEAENINKAVETAEAELAAATKKHDDLVAKYKEVKGNDADLYGIEDYKKNYKDPVEFAQIKLNNAKTKRDNLTAFEPYETTMDYFGLSESRAKSMIEKQVNSCTYTEVRRAQIEATGVAAPVYMEELGKAFREGLTFDNASAEDKKRMQEVYATKQLVQEKLDSKKGFSGWLWRLFNRTETKAMRNYINGANQALNKAGFEDKHATEANEAMSEKGYFHSEYKTSNTADIIKEKFAENEKVYAPIRAYRAELKAIADKPLEDQYFEIKFRPSTKDEVFKEQVRAYNTVKPIVENLKKEGKIPRDVLTVFYANSKKLKMVSDLYKQGKARGTNELHNAEPLCEKEEQALMDKGNHDNYVPMKFSDVKALENLKESVHVDFDKDVANVDVSKPITEAPSLKQNPLEKK